MYRKKKEQSKKRKIKAKKLAMKMRENQDRESLESHSSTSKEGTTNESPEPRPGCSKERTPEPQPSCSNNRGPIESVTWSKEDKFALLQAFKAFGSYDIDSIKTRLPHKTKEDIEATINAYKAHAVKHYNVDRRRKKNKQESTYKPTLPLSNWANLLVDTIGYEDLHTELATALRTIAEVEDIPPAVLTENIDFRAAYHLLANALEGKELTVESKFIADLLNRAIVDTALTSKGFISNSSLQHLLDNLTISKESKPCQLPIISSPEQAATHRLASQSNYNPLNLSLDHLKPET